MEICFSGHRQLQLPTEEATGITGAVRNFLKRPHIVQNVTLADFSMRKSLIPHFLSLLYLTEGLYGNIGKKIQEAVVAPGCKQRAKLKRNVLFCEDFWVEFFSDV